MMATLQTTRPSVLERARRGNATELARLYAPLAYAVARKRGLSEHDAEDLMQQTMLELLQLLPTFKYDRGRGTFKGLIKTMVLHRTADLLRARRNGARPDGIHDLAPAAPADDVDALFDREWQKTHLMEALDRIRSEVKPRTFQSFQLAVLCGRSIEEVAEMLGLSRNQVSQNKRRVILRLRAHLQELQRDTA